MITIRFAAKAREPSVWVLRLGDMEAPRNEVRL
jgi:hypothetical protein